MNKTAKTNKPKTAVKAQPIDYEKRILTVIKTNGDAPLPYRTLLRACKVGDGEFPRFTKVLEGMKRDCKITEKREGFVLADEASFVRAVITRLNRTFGFAKREDTDEEIFISGRYLKGAMPHDVALVKLTKDKDSTSSAEGEVVRVLEENFSQFTGIIVKEFNRLRIIPDTLSKYAIDYENPLGLDLREGDKVLAEVTVRGNRHSDHLCKITASFGSSLKASVCALSVLELEGVTPIFPDEVIDEARRVSDQRTVTREIKNRLDLRGELIFTIDGADTKDIDDAVSVEKTDDGYKLGVHIADVSFYVKPKSALDNEAFNRGTSVYYANRVIPMLPPELSNGICSLNPNQERCAFSALMKLDNNGQLVDFDFKKTVIRSRVKGVYAEINAILAGNSTPELDEKYAEVSGCFAVMTELAEILKKRRFERGAPELESVESKLIIDENDYCVDVKPRSRGFTEELIEDFMLVANEAAAKFGAKNQLPFVYRVHENPSAEKIDALCQTLSLLNIPIPNHKAGEIKPSHLNEILRAVRDTDKQLIINNMVLRSMAKAKYSAEPIGHFGLVLEDYAHFTSPIRRYPDLTIHRIMSDFLDCGSSAEVNKRFQKFSFASADRSTETELRAMRIERGCEDCYKAEYMSSHVGEEFVGIICSVADFGFFVTLENTCEGLCHKENLPQGEYFCDNGLRLRNLSNGRVYTVGEKIKVRVQNCNVSSGKVDFAEVV